MWPLWAWEPLARLIRCVHAEDSSIPLSRRALSRGCTWGRKDADLPRQQRPPELSQPAGLRGRPLRLDVSGVLPDDEPLPPGDRYDTRESLRRHADPQRRLRPGIQLQIWTLGTRLRRPLLV